MPCTLNSALFHRALGAAHAGDVNHGDWNAPSGSDRTAHNSIGHDASAAGTADEYKYPIFGSDGKLSAKGVGTALGYARKGNETALIGPLQQISDAIRKDAGASGDNRLIYLHMAKSGEFIVHTLSSAADELPATVSGEPAQYRWKDLVHTGDYTHPILHFRLSVASHDLDDYVKNFNLMLSRGVEVPINVDHSEAADDNRGFLKKVARGRIVDGKVQFDAKSDTLIGLCQFIGKDAALTAARNRVSVGVNPHYKDGEGNQYKGGVIQHVALTPLPVVPDQQPFVIAASRAAAGGDVLTLAAVEIPNAPPLFAGNPARITTMDETMLPCSQATLDGLHKHVPGLESVSNPEKMSRVGQHIATTHDHVKTMARCLGVPEQPSVTSTLSMAAEQVQARHNQDIEDAGGASAVANLSVAQIGQKAAEKRKFAFESIQENSKLRERLEEKDKQIATLSAATVKPLDPENQRSVIEAAGVLADSLVAEGSLTPAVKESLLSLLTVSGGKTNTLAMSAAANPQGNGPLVLAILKACKGNKPMALSGKTGDLQTLSRVVPGAQPDADASKTPDQKFREFVGSAGENKTVL